MLQNSFNYYTLQAKSVKDKYNMNQKDIEKLKGKQDVDSLKKIQSLETECI